MNLLKALAAGLLLFFAAGAMAESPFRVMTDRVQFRDAVIDPGAGFMYMAVHNRDEVWAYSLQSRLRTNAVHVGRGPVALALSPDGKILACANRLDNTISLIRLPEFIAYGTVPTEDGPVSLTALPDGRFAAVNTFSDSITVVNPQGSGSASTIKNTPGVPVGIAATNNFLGVIGRTETALFLYRIATLGEPERIPLDGAPTVAVGLSNDVFAVATAAGISLVDASAKKVTAQSGHAAMDLCADQDALYVLGEKTIAKLDTSLNEVESLELYASATRLAVRNGQYLAMTPKLKACQYWDSVSAPPTPAEIAMAQPPKKPEETAKGPEKPPVLLAKPPALPALAPTAPKPKTPPPATPEETGGTPPAPIAKPSASPLDRMSGRSITDVFKQPTEFGALESGFEPPDYTNPLRDVECDKMVQDIKNGITHMERNVRLRLGNMLFRADSLTKKDQTGEFHVEGNVSVDQESSRFTADAVTYWMPQEKDVPPQLPIEAKLGEQDEAKRRLALGRVEAANIHLIEPTRELVAETVSYDFAKSTGEFTNVHGRAGIYYFAADSLTVTGPRSFIAQQMWITTCDKPKPHYKIRMKELRVENGQTLSGTHARLQFGDVNTPLWAPKWKSSDSEHPWNADFRTGRTAELGYYFDTGMRFNLTPDVRIGPRIFPTEKEGFAGGLDLDYDFMKNPASPLFSTKGEAHGLVSTEGRGYGHWYHRYEYSDDLIARAQVEYWDDEDVYKDFYYEQYKHRTAPRNFVNVTYRHPEFLASATIRPNVHSWVSETERLPEATFHLIDRQIARNLYLSYDVAAGYNQREQKGDTGGRLANVTRLTYDWNIHEAINVAPFLEMQSNSYLTTDMENEDLDADNGSALTGTAGITAQTRFHRLYPGFWNFSEFKHLVVPSVSLSFRPDVLTNLDSIPQYDTLDNIYGRLRVESKLDNLLFGRDAKSKQTWQVLRLTLYQGNDLWNEMSITQDYEAEIDIRPRAFYGYQLAAERHSENQDNIPYLPKIQRSFYQWYADAFGRSWSKNAEVELNSSYGDYNRVLTHLYYDDTPLGGRLSGRVGFAYTETGGKKYNEDILYGMGYKLGENWALRFEHVFDISNSNLRTQTYEIRRTLHCWEAGIRLRKRESGLDISFEVSIKAFPGTKIKI